MARYELIFPSLGESVTEVVRKYRDLDYTDK